MSTMCPQCGNEDLWYCKQIRFRESYEWIRYYATCDNCNDIFDISEDEVDRSQLSVERIKLQDEHVSAETEHYFKNRKD